MSRIEETFARLRRQGRIGLIAFLTTGFPDVASTLSLVPAALEGGADIVELGVPFSDPLADGTTIQRASAAALEQGVTLQTCLEVVGEMRRRGVAAPLLLMGYYNPFLHYGLEAFAKQAAGAGADGVIVPDLPPEAAHPFREALSPCGVDLVFLLAPTSTEERIKQAAQLASGFLYCVSLTGVTGARAALSTAAHDLVSRVRRLSDLPIAVGFGISRPEHVQALRGKADAAVVGSALIDAIEKAPPDERAQRVKALMKELSGQPHGTRRRG
ncbi:MAG: tryptophan synthase subunit alpha [Chloroflexi bacterium]|nr:tryptophan synthase subunit alpha [Chloroflexota bacterium]